MLKEIISIYSSNCITISPYTNIDSYGKTMGITWKSSAHVYPIISTQKTSCDMQQHSHNKCLHTHTHTHTHTHLQTQRGLNLHNRTSQRILGSHLDIFLEICTQCTVCHYIFPPITREQQLLTFSCFRSVFKFVLALVQQESPKTLHTKREKNQHGNLPWSKTNVDTWI